MEEASSKQIVHTSNAPQAIGPYSQAVRTRSMVFTAGQIGLDPTTALDVNGACKCTSFRTNSGAILVSPGATGTEAIAFGGRSVYIIKASWSGNYQEGTRAWYVLTHNDMNSFTGHPTIIEIGMTTGSYHTSDTLTLQVDGSLPYNQLRLNCQRSAGSQARNCLWSITRVAYN